MNQYCFNKRYNVDDPELQQSLQYMADLLVGLSPEEPLGVFPWMRFFPDSENIKTMKRAIRSRDKHLQREFDEHRRTLDPDNIRDITDSLLCLFSEDEEVHLKVILPCLNLTIKYQVYALALLSDIPIGS